jgi:hypothetical protein
MSRKRSGHGGGSDDHHPRLEHHGLGDITASLVWKAGMICLEQHVSRIDRMSGDRQSNVIECQLYAVRSKLKEC